MILFWTIFWTLTKSSCRGEEWSGRSRKKIFIFRLFFYLFCFRIFFFFVNSKFCHFQEKLKSTERKYFWKRKFSMQKSLNFFRWDGQTKIIIAVHIFTLERMKETCFNQTFWWFHLNNVEHILVENKFLSFSNVNIKMPKRWERTIFLVNAFPANGSQWKGENQELLIS